MDGSTFDGTFRADRDDAWIERLLREDAAAQPHIDDAGFTARLMQHLPARTTVTAPRWLVPGATIAASTATVFFTPAGGWFAETFIRTFGQGQLSLGSLMVLAPIAVLYACSFASVRD